MRGTASKCNRNKVLTFSLAPHVLFTCYAVWQLHRQSSLCWWNKCVNTTSCSWNLRPNRETDTHNTSIITYTYSPTCTKMQWIDEHAKVVTSRNGYISKILANHFQVSEFLIIPSFPKFASYSTSSSLSAGISYQGTSKISGDTVLISKYHSDCFRQLVYNAKFTKCIYEGWCSTLGKSVHSMQIIEFVCTCIY